MVVFLLCTMDFWTIVSHFIPSIVTFLTLGAHLWKVMDFVKNLEKKVDPNVFSDHRSSVESRFHQIFTELQLLQRELESLRRDKVDAAVFQSLRAEIEHIRDVMMRRDDFLTFKSELRRELLDIFRSNNG